MINKRELIFAITLFIALYVVELTLISTLRLRGNAAIATVWTTIAVQLVLTVFFLRLRKIAAGFVGIVALGIQLSMQIVGLLMVSARF